MICVLGCNNKKDGMVLTFDPDISRANIKKAPLGAKYR